MTRLRLWPIGLVLVGTVVVVSAQQPTYLVTGPGGTAIPTSDGGAGVTTANTTRIVPASDATFAIAPGATAVTTNSVSECNILSAASTNATSCKGSSGNVYGFEVYNTTTTVYYLRLYNTASAPTCSSATGFIRSIPVPPGASAGLVAGVATDYSVPVGYSTGIGYCLTGGSASTDNTNAATGIFGAIRLK